jgi:hypothetical protein
MTGGDRMPEKSCKGLANRLGAGRTPRSTLPFHPVLLRVRLIADGIAIASKRPGKLASACAIALCLVIAPALWQHRAYAANPPHVPAKEELSDAVGRQAAEEHDEPVFEREDCKVAEALCRSECVSAADAAPCAATLCAPAFQECVRSLPVGKTVSLPVACVEADQSAFRALERQGELLDADPTLFAESYHTFIRARIACRAGFVSKALNSYDEIRESLAVKTVPASVPQVDSRAGR